MSERKSENSSGYEHETTNKSQKSMPKDIFYESRSKTYKIVRRIIFKDSNGIFKETLDVVNGEKQTIFGSPPDLAKYEDWMIDELTEPHNIRKANEPTNASQSRFSSNSSDTDTANVDKAHISLLNPDISEEIQSIEYSHLKDLGSSFKPSTTPIDSSSSNTLDENAFRDDISHRIKPNNDEKLDSSTPKTLDTIAVSRDSESTFKPKPSSVDSSSSSTTTSTDSSSSNTSEENAVSRDPNSTFIEGHSDERKSNLDEEIDSSSINTLDEVVDSRDSASKFQKNLDKQVRPAFSIQNGSKFLSSSSDNSDKIADSKVSDSTIKEDPPHVNRSSMHNRLSSRDSSASNTSNEIADSKFTKNLDKTFRVARQFSRQVESSITNTSDEFSDLLNSHEDSDFRHLQHEASSKYRPSNANAPNRRMWENGRNNNLSKTWSSSTTNSKIELEREDMKDPLTTMISDLQNRMHRNQSEVRNERRNQIFFRNHDSVQSTQQQNFDCIKCQHLKSRLSAARPYNASLSSSRSSMTCSSKHRAVCDGHQRSRNKMDYGREAMDYYLRPTNDSVENLTEFVMQNYRPSNDRNMRSRVEFVEQYQQSHSLNQRRNNDRARKNSVERPSNDRPFVKQNHFLHRRQSNDRPRNDVSDERFREFVKQKHYLNLRPSNDNPRNDISIENLMQFVKQNQTYESDRSAKRMSKRIAKQQLKNINKWTDRLPSLDSSDHVYGVSYTSVFSYIPTRRVNEPNRYFDRRAYAFQGSQQPK